MNFDRCGSFPLVYLSYRTYFQLRVTFRSIHLNELHQRNWKKESSKSILFQIQKYNALIFRFIVYRILRPTSMKEQSKNWGFVVKLGKVTFCFLNCRFISVPSFDVQFQHTIDYFCEPESSGCYFGTVIPLSSQLIDNQSLRSWGEEKKDLVSKKLLRDFRAITQIFANDASQYREQIQTRAPPFIPYYGSPYSCSFILIFQRAILLSCLR